jgi:hypothetical protein
VTGRQGAGDGGAPPCSRPARAVRPLGPAQLQPSSLAAVAPLGVARVLRSPRSAGGGCAPCKAGIWVQLPLPGLGPNPNAEGHEDHAEGRGPAGVAMKASCPTAGPNPNAEGHEDHAEGRGPAGVAMNLGLAPLGSAATAADGSGASLRATGPAKRRAVAPKARGLDLSLGHFGTHGVCDA